SLGSGATVGYPSNTCGPRPAPPAGGEESTEFITAHRSAVGLGCPYLSSAGLTARCPVGLTEPNWIQSLGRSLLAPMSGGSPGVCRFLELGTPFSPPCPGARLFRRQLG